MASPEKLAANQDQQSLSDQSESLLSQLSDSKTSWSELTSNLEDATDTLSLSQRISILSAVGQSLHAGYDHGGVTIGATCEELLQNARNGGNSGGQCGAIHRCLMAVEQALGFDAASVGSFRTTPGSSLSSHRISVFCDANSSQCFIQNYGSIVGIPITQANNLAQAVDVAIRHLGPLATRALVHGGGPMLPFQNGLQQWQQKTIDFALSDSRPLALGEITKNGGRMDLRVPFVPVSAPMALSVFSFYREQSDDFGKYSIQGLDSLLTTKRRLTLFQNRLQTNLNASASAGGIGAQAPRIFCESRSRNRDGTLDGQ